MIHHHHVIGWWDICVNRKLTGGGGWWDVPLWIKEKTSMFFTDSCCLCLGRLGMMCWNKETSWICSRSLTDAGQDYVCRMINKLYYCSHFGFSCLNWSVSDQFHQEPEAWVYSDLVTNWIQSWISDSLQRTNLSSQLKNPTWLPCCSNSLNQPSVPLGPESWMITCHVAEKSVQLNQRINCEKEIKTGVDCELWKVLGSSSPV